MSRRPSIAERRQNREKDAYILYFKHRIDTDEYKRLIDLIRSPDEGNLCVAQAIIKAIFKKYKKLKNEKK